MCATRGGARCRCRQEHTPYGVRSTLYIYVHPTTLLQYGVRVLRTPLVFGSAPQGKTRARPERRQPHRTHVSSPSSAGGMTSGHMRSLGVRCIRRTLHTHECSRRARIGRRPWRVLELGGNGASKGAGIRRGAFRRDRTEELRPMGELAESISVKPFICKSARHAGGQAAAASSD